MTLAIHYVGYSVIFITGQCHFIQQYQVYHSKVQRQPDTMLVVLIAYVY